MIITEITRQNKNPDRYNIFIDGQFAFAINGTDLLYHKLAVGTEIRHDLYEKLQDELDYAKARDVAVRYLAHRPRSTKEVQGKLVAGQYSEASIQRVLKLLTDGGYLDDVNFAALFIQQKSSLANYGKRRIITELFQKGVAKEDIMAAYGRAFAEDGTEAETEQAAATRAIEKKLRNKDAQAILNDQKELARLTAFLARRGFSFGVIKTAINEQQARLDGH
ncbi:MAG: RecX family transcriptional regulator [Defluviitaleaceae bacterium]|nr:RecX family transcriptional regulator [Defluviitaleaceae bacterium]